VQSILSNERVPLDEEEWSSSDSSEYGEGQQYTNEIDKSTELEQSIYEMAEINTGLYDLAILFKTNTSKDIFIKAATIDISFFVNWDINHVAQKFPQAESWLQQRLGRANSRRRQKFKYLQQHHTKFAHNISSGPSLILAQRSAADDPTMTRQDRERTTTVPTVSQHTSAPTQTTVDTIIDNDQNIFQDDGLSETTSVASEGVDEESGLNIPSPPPGAIEGLAFECPYCYEIMKISSIGSWK
jgi:hypothetical protein